MFFVLFLFNISRIFYEKFIKNSTKSINSLNTVFKKQKVHIQNYIE